MTVLHFLTVHFYRIYKMVEVARIHFKTFRQKCGIYLNCYIWEIFLVSARARVPMMQLYKAIKNWAYLATVKYRKTIRMSEQIKS